MSTMSPRSRDAAMNRLKEAAERVLSLRTLCRVKIDIGDGKGLAATGVKLHRTVIEMESAWIAFPETYWDQQDGRGSCPKTEEVLAAVEKSARVNSWAEVVVQKTGGGKF